MTASVEQLTPTEWCELLFSETEGWINIFAIDANGVKQSRWARNAEQFGTIIADADFGDTWVGCATRHENLGTRRGNDEECWEVPGMWLDIDIKGPTHKHENLPPDRESAIELLKDFPLRPTVVLNSGGGLQAWWLFDEPRNAPDVAELLNYWRATWQELGQRRGWHVDHVFDVARILRVPGTKNHKTDPPIPVTIAHLSRDRRYMPDDLLQYTVELPEVVEVDRSTPYDGPERPGDRYNAATDPARLLEDHGCVIDQVNRDGSRNYRAPHHATEKGMNGITVFADGKTIIYSETFADEYGFEQWTDAAQTKRRLYDAFGLYAYFEHNGNFAAAREALEPREPVSSILPDGTQAATLVPGTTLSVVSMDEIQLDARFVRGGQFIFDDDAEIDIRWGVGSDVLWATGESLMICGPPGVGKTTLAHQIVAGLLGLQDEVLGFPIVESKRVLYLAMDRPKQIRRAIRRLFTEEVRDHLDERLTIQNGPIPYDLGKRPDLLLDLAYAATADVVFIDSLKDAAIKLSDDETGGNVNRAIQMCNAEGVDVAVLHHQRKGIDGQKPTKLEDVYGSIWLTAGTGSVVLLWGEAGNEHVELSHLKQPMDVVGPLEVEHDHILGLSKVIAAFDVLAYFRNHGKPASRTDVARAQFSTDAPTATQKKAAERKLRRLESDGKVVRLAQQSIGQEALYELREEGIGALIAS